MAININGEIQYTAKEAADMLGITVDNLRQRRHKGQINGIKKGGSWFYTEQEMIRQLNKGKELLTEQKDKNTGGYFYKLND